MREHRQSETPETNDDNSHTSVFLHFTRLSILRYDYYYSSHSSKTFTLPLSLFLSSSSLTSRSFLFSPPFRFQLVVVLFRFFIPGKYSSSSTDGVRIIIIINRCFPQDVRFQQVVPRLPRVSRRDVENTTAENPIKNVDASESFASSPCSKNLGLLISLLTFGEASELEIRHFFYSLKSLAFFSGGR